MWCFERENEIFVILANFETHKHAVPTDFEILGDFSNQSKHQYNLHFSAFCKLDCCFKNI